MILMEFLQGKKKGYVLEHFESFFNSVPYGNWSADSANQLVIIATHEDVIRVTSPLFSLAVKRINEINFCNMKLAHSEPLPVNRVLIEGVVLCVGQTERPFLLCVCIFP